MKNFRAITPHIEFRDRMTLQVGIEVSPTHWLRSR
jgi:hypothetical protein